MLVDTDLEILGDLDAINVFATDEQKTAMHRRVLDELAVLTSPSDSETVQLVSDNLAHVVALSEAVKRVFVRLLTLQAGRMMMVLSLNVLSREAVDRLLNGVPIPETVEQMFANFQKGKPQ